MLNIHFDTYSLLQIWIVLVYNEHIDRFIMITNALMLFSYYVDTDQT